MNTNQHILLYTDDYGLGGVAQYNHSILLELARLGYRVSCVQTRSENPLITAAQAAGVQYIWLDFDTVSGFGRTFNHAEDAQEIFGTHRPDFIIFSDSCPLSNFAAKLVAMDWGIPFIVVVGFVAPYLAERFAGALDLLQEQYSIAKAVVAVSQENLDLLHQLFRLPIGKGEVIYYGRPASYFLTPDLSTRDRLRQEIGVPRDAVLCFTAARLEAVKGFQYQLEVISHLQHLPIWQQLYFVWAGDGSLKSSLLEQIQQMGVGDRVILLGQRWDVVDWLAAADIFVFPTQLEGMPLAVMEAMAKGLPVVASAVSGIPEELGDTGQLLPDPVADPQGAVSLLVATLQNWATQTETRKAVGQACQRRAELMFQESQMVEKTMQTIQHALLPAGDYVAPGLQIVQPDAAFPHMVQGDRSQCDWPYLRREVPHNWYVDERFPVVGFLSRDEANLLYNLALQFKGKRALEIGCWMGWSACHLALAGVKLDVIDPLLTRPEFYQSVSSSLKAANVLNSVNLVPGFSPQKVEEIANQHQRKWSLLFIDGNHEAPAPLQDAIACEPFAEADAMVVFHDLASPEVSEGLDYFRQQGWNTLIYQTMQIMGIAWRGNVQPVQHQPDLCIKQPLPRHLQHFDISDTTTIPQFAQTAVLAGSDSMNQDLTDKDEFAQLLKVIHPFTLLSESRLFSLYSAAKHICLADMPGNFVECGTYKGGSAALVAWVIKKYSQRQRFLYACDTFEGMPDPTDVDKHQGIAANETGFGAGTLKAPLDENLMVVSKALQVQEIVIPVKGLFADTLPEYKGEMGSIALLHADGDWYESTMDVFNILYDSVIEDGFIQVDDYGFWEGCRRAIHDFESQNQVLFDLHQIDSTGVWFRKRKTYPWSVYSDKVICLVFPDWQQPEEKLLADLTECLEAVLIQSDTEQIALLLDTTGIDPEAADLLLSSAVMQVLDGAQLRNAATEPEIVLLPRMDGEAWRMLLPCVAVYIQLERQNEVGIRAIASMFDSTTWVTRTLSDLKNTPLTLSALVLEGSKVAGATQLEKISRAIAQSQQDPNSAAALETGRWLRQQVGDNLAHLPVDLVGPWLKSHLQFLLKAPPIFEQVGETTAYLQYIKTLVNYLHTQIVTFPGSPDWYAIAEILMRHGNFIPLYFTTEDLKTLYEQRAEIIAVVLQRQGCVLDYEFAERLPDSAGDRDKVRLGILAAHFTPQTETFATIPIFQHLNREQFEIILYAFSNTDHRLERYCAGHADALVILPEDIREQAQIIREDNLDILWIGTNTTAVTNQVTLLSMHRLARVQMTGMNSPVSTGMQFIDYYLSSQFTSFQESAQRHYRETLVFLKTAAQCFEFATESYLSPTTRSNRETLGLSSDVIVFVSGANFHKITPELEAAWAKIIAAVPNSILMLYPFNPHWSNTYPRSAFHQRLAARFAQEGLNEDRFRVLEAAPNRADVIERLKLADVYLDSYPFSGMTSLLEPLELGLPTLVMEVDAPVSLARGAAFLRELEVPELIVADEQSYVEQAIALGTNPAWRKEMRDRICQSMAKTPSFLDSRRYGAEVEAVLKGLFETYQKSCLIQNYSLRTVNLLVLPDWQQPQEALFTALLPLFRDVVLHPDRAELTLLIDIGELPAEAADLFISEIVMHLLMEEGLEIAEEGPEISAVAGLSSWQRKVLLDCVTAYVPLPIEDGDRLKAWGAEMLPVFNLSSS